MTPDELKARRIALSLSQKALAEQLGLSKNHYSRIETGQHPITRVLELAIERLEQTIDNSPN